MLVVDQNRRPRVNCHSGTQHRTGPSTLDGHLPDGGSHGRSNALHTPLTFYANAANADLGWSTIGQMQNDLDELIVAWEEWDRQCLRRAVFNANGKRIRDRDLPTVGSVLVLQKALRRVAHRLGRKSSSVFEQLIECRRNGGSHAEAIRSLVEIPKRELDPL